MGPFLLPRFLISLTQQCYSLDTRLSKSRCLPPSFCLQIETTGCLNIKLRRETERAYFARYRINRRAGKTVWGLTSAADTSLAAVRSTSRADLWMITGCFLAGTAVAIIPYFAGGADVVWVLGGTFSLTRREQLK